jgi:hypothetical protein
VEGAMDSLKKKLFSLTKAQIVIIAAIFLVLCIFLMLFIGSVWGSIKQPIAFNHKIHADNELMCLDCHIYYEDHASSGRPTLEICSGCHEEPQGEGREEKKIVEHVQSGEEVEWKRLYRVPEDVLFSHRRHVVLGELECAQCHGKIGESTKPPAKPLKIKMKKCMNCHEDAEVSNDCISCHR